MKYLFAAIPVVGHVYPMVKVGEELVKRGHEVNFLTGSGLESTIKSHNLKFTQIKNTPIQSQQDFFNGVTKSVGFEEESQIMRRVISLLWETYSESEEKILAYNPDILFVDSATYAPAAVSRKYDLKWATSSAFPSMIPTKTAPPFTGRMIQPAKNEQEQKQIEQMCIDSEKFLSDNFDGLINGYLSKLGIPANSPAISYANLSPELIISYSAKEFEYPRKDWPAGLQLVGPGDWDMSSGEKINLPEKFIYVTLGTFWSKQHQDTFGKIIKGLEDYGGNIIVTSGNDIPENLINPEKNEKVIIHKYIPNSEIIPKSELVIHHGGFGTTMGTIKSAKSSLVLPIDLAQHENAARIHYRGVGDYLLSSDLTPQNIASKVSSLLNNPQVEKNAILLSEQLKNYTPIKHSADILEKY